MPEITQNTLEEALLALALAEYPDNHGANREILNSRAYVIDQLLSVGGSIALRNKVVSNMLRFRDSCTGEEAMYYLAPGIDPNLAIITMRYLNDEGRPDLAGQVARDYKLTS